MQRSPLDPQLSTITRRLDQLERSNRRLRGVALALGLGLCGTLSVGFSRPRDKVVEAERFVVIDADGNTRGAFGMTENGDAHCYLTQGDATMIVSLKQGASMLLRGDDGRRGAFIGVDSAGMSRLELVSEKLMDGIRLVTKPDGGTGIYLADSTGLERASLDYHPEGGVAFTTRDEKNRVRTYFGLDGRGVPSLVLRDAQNRSRIGMLLSDDGRDTPLLAIEDEQQRMRLEMSTHFDGSPFVKMYREDGEPSYELP